MAFALCGPVAAGVTVTPAAKGYDIDIDGESSASELIDAIAGATGVEIKGHPEDATIGPNHLRNTSLERALRQLLPKAPFAVRFDADETPEAIIFLSPSQDGAAGDENDGADGSGGADEGENTDPAEQAPADDPDSPEDTAPDDGG